MPGCRVHPRSQLKAQDVARQRQRQLVPWECVDHRGSGHTALPLAALPHTGVAHLREGMGVTIFPPLSPSGGMADATDSKSVGGNPMRVRLSPRASAMMLLIPPVQAQ